MKTKIVYVLTSSEKDCYLEQALLSIYSARMHNLDANIILVVDRETNHSLQGSRAVVKDYVSSIISENLPSDLSNMQKSRFLKTKLREIVTGDFLYIDTDTIITDSLSEIDNWNIEIGGVADCHLPIHEHLWKVDILKFARLIKWKIPQNDIYINGGVLYVKDTQMAHKLYNEWHNLWLKYSKKFKLYIDMPPLAKANENCGYPIKEIPDIYNCQVIENGLKYLYHAKIIHYFASNVGRYDCPYIFRDPKLYNVIKKYGITDEIKEKLLEPKTAFLSKCTIIGGNQSEIYKTPSVAIARRISLKFPKLNLVLDKIINKRN